ncbi:cell division protein DedD [Alishewanella longhuensis]|uniref:Cell division protein DedD n=1 Tax=Alishewanella longhuensis TaxID=1091037 RepID=A0ABQ3KW54_9ALTE|nr:SPOR domain-containing protein [Alishewanella longhuensis]GHG64320.1 cell division protein DedD [Alishewanella longhuensis]
MTAKFKHRLLGTSILVLAGIIFLPDLLDGEKQIVKDDFKVIPDRPEFQGVQELVPFDDAEFAARAQQVAEQLVNDEKTLDEQSAVAQTETLPSQQYAQVTVESPTQARTEVATTQTSSAAAAVSNNATGLSQAAWVVRVGSFSNQQNANALVAKLRQAGFTTFTRNITNSAGQSLTSVFVGPELRRERLEQGLPKLQQLTGVERLMISNYQPTENN